jgi:hypothetical protein
MLFPFMHLRNSRKYIPQGLKAKKVARLMSGLKPGPTQLGGFPQPLKSCRSSREFFRKLLKPLQPCLRIAELL